MFRIEKSGRSYEVLEPQPDPSELLVINRVYSELKANNEFRKRISWIDNMPERFSSMDCDFAIYEKVK